MSSILLYRVTFMQFVANTEKIFAKCNRCFYSLLNYRSIFGSLRKHDFSLFWPLYRHEDFFTFFAHVMRLGG